MLKKLICKLFGHVPVSVDVINFTAKCRRCGKKLKVAYDMAYGGTIEEEQ